MSDLILHHFDASPFAEKIRLVFGLKNLAWNSVELPMIMPKPDLTALTGGYRKTPVLQIGAEVYVDTALIADELEHRYPTPSLYPDGNKAMYKALAFWSNNSFFQPGAGLSMGVNDQVPDEVLDDRFSFFNFMDFDVLEDEIPYLYEQFLTHAGFVESQLADGREYLFGDQVSWADVNAWFVFWMAHGNIPPIKSYFEKFTYAAAWEERIAEFGYGKRNEMPASEAHAIANNTDARPGQGVESLYQTFSEGQAVSVAAEDYGKDAVTGELITLNQELITINRDDPVAGNVNVHFPRAGFRITAL